MWFKGNVNTHDCSKKGNIGMKIWGFKKKGNLKVKKS